MPYLATTRPVLECLQMSKANTGCTAKCDMQNAKCNMASQFTFNIGPYAVYRFHYFRVEAFRDVIRICWPDDALIFLLSFMSRYRTVQYCIKNGRSQFRWPFPNAD